MTLLLACSAGTATAALIADETFGYPPTTPLDGQFGGTGWASAWQLSAGAEAIAPGFTYTDSAGNSLATGPLTKARFDASAGAASSTRLINALRGTDGTTTWISFLGVRTGPTTNTSANIYPAGAGVTLIDTITEPGNTINRLVIGNVTGAAANNWSLTPAGALANLQSSTSPFDQLSLVVVRIDHLAGNDNAYLWVNPTLGGAPDTNAAAAESLGAFDFSFDGVQPFADAAGTGFPHAVFDLDQIRIGDTFADVTPQPPALVAYESFDYAVDLALGFQGGGTPGWTNELAETTLWSDDAFTATIERGSLLYRDAQGNTLVTYANKVRLNGSTAANLATRQLITTRGEDGTSSWLSFLVSRVGPTAAGANPYPAAAYLSLANTNLVSSQDQLAVGNAASQPASTVSLIPDASAANIQSSGAAFGTNVVLVLVRIDHKAGNDDAYLWVNPTLSSEPATNNASAQSVGAFDFSFNSVRLFAQDAVGGAHAELLVDEIRIGNTFSSVAPFIPVLIAYEGFNYDPATVTNLTGQNGGIGFSAPWGSAAGDPAASILPGSLTYTDSLGNQLVTTGNRAFSAGATNAGTSPQPQRDLPHTVGTDGTTSWWSFIAVRKGPVYQPDGLPPKYRRVASLQLHDLNPGAVERVAVGRGTENSGTIHFLGPQPWDTWGIYDVASQVRSTNSTVPWDEQAFLLVRIDHHGGNSKDGVNNPGDIDEAWLWVNPDLSSEPSTNTALAMGLSFSNVTTMTIDPRSDLSFNRIKAFVGGNQQTFPVDNHAEFEFDEIRLGQTFESVTPHVSGSQPMVSIRRNGNQIEITWSGGALESAPAVTGPWVPVVGASSPVHTEPLGPAPKFFRAAQ